MYDGIRKNRIDVLIFALLFVLFLVPIFTDAPHDYIRSFIGEHYIRSAVAFTVLMFLATVVAPITVPFAVPAAAVVLGPLPTAFLAIFGWTLGASVAFFLARRFGRSLVARVINIERIDRLERFIPERSLFFWMVLLRMLLPVDVLSYAFGLFSGITFVPYLGATILGIAPFAFILAFMGDALLTSDYGRVGGLLGLCAVLLVVGWILALRTKE